MANIHCPKYEQHYENIKKYYKQGISNKEIVTLLNDPRITKPSQISKIASRLGVSKKTNKMAYKYFEEKDKQALELIKNGMSCTQAAKNLNLDAQTMTARLKKFYGLNVLPDGKKTINSQYFDIIDTEEKAYWLGFLFADGCVSDRNEIEVTLQECDKKHLEKLCKAINSSHKIRGRQIKGNNKTYNAVRLSFKDTNISNALKKHGCIPRKSNVVQVPDLASQELYRHFFRGYFDGNGSITNRGKTYISCGISCGSKDFSYAFIDYAKEIVKVYFSMKIDTRSKNNVYNPVTTSRYEALRFLNFLYDESTVYLDRKYQQYLNICRSESISLETLNYEDGIKRGWRNVD